MRKLKKRWISVMISIALAALWCCPAFAGSPSGDGKLWSIDYVYGLALEANGIYMEPGYLTYSVNAFKSWLTKNNHDAALSFYNAADKADWGASVSGMQEFTEAVRLYLQESTDYGKISNGDYIDLPSRYSSYSYQTSSSLAAVWNEKYSDIPEIPDSENYDYLYSDSFRSDSGHIFRANCYVEKGAGILAIVDYLPRNNRLKVQFYKLDPSSDLGYSLITVYKMYYDATADSAITQPSPSGASYYDVNVLPLLPFPVFPTSEAAQEYCRTGSMKHAFTTSYAPYPVARSNNELAALETITIPDTITLPSSSAAAQTTVSSFASVGSQEVPDVLKDAGFPVSYRLPYTLEYYKDGELSGTGSGFVPSSDPYVRESDLVGFRYYLLDPDASSPFPFQVTLTDHAIRASYVPDSDAVYPYTIEYYKDGESFQTVSGSVPVFGEHTVTECEDFCPQYYLLDAKVSAPLPFEVTEQNNTIRIYYIKDTSAVFPYTVEYYKDGESFKTVSGSVSVFSNRITSCEDFCPSYYLLDAEASTSFPFEVTEGKNTIQIYYKKDQSAVFPYTVEYHKDGEVFKTVSRDVPVFGEHIVRECEDFCPQYYLPDSKASTLLPFEVTEEKNVIHVYYKRDLYATFPYTVEYYQDGELFKTIPASVSVFDPSVKSCISYCPRGYVLDVTASTPLPYEVSADGGVVRNYYVRQDTVIPYTVEYYRDGLRMSVFSGNVPSASPVLQSFPSRCPEYYKPDQERSTPMPYTVPEGGGRIKVYYVKDEGAVFPYTVECYKDGKLVETASRTVSVFNPAVKEYGFDCPEGYVVDTSSSTTLPYSVSKDGNVIKYCYVDEGKTLPYTVEYHKDGKVQMTIAGNVPVTSPEVKQYWPYSPSGYLLDEEASDSLPFTVTPENNVIHAYYIPDPSNPYASFVSGVKTMMNAVAGFFKAAFWWLIFLVILVIFCDRNMVIFKRITSHAWKKEPKRKQKVLTAPKSKFMKGVHANKGSSLRSKANMQKGVRPGSLRSKATISDRRWKGGYSRRR